MGSKIKVATLAVFFAFLLTAVLSVHPFGVPVNTQMDDYFIRYGQAETGSNNIVTSVVFDYREMDTFGEATVLFSAAVGIFLLLGRLKNEK